MATMIHLAVYYYNSYKADDGPPPELRFACGAPFNENAVKDHYHLKLEDEIQLLRDRNDELAEGLAQYAERVSKLVAVLRRAGVSESIIRRALSGANDDDWGTYMLERVDRAGRQLVRSAEALARAARPPRRPPFHGHSAILHDAHPVRVRGRLLDRARNSRWTFPAATVAWFVLISLRGCW